MKYSRLLVLEASFDERVPKLSAPGGVAELPGGAAAEDRGRVLPHGGARDGGGGEDARGPRDVRLP